MKIVVIEGPGFADQEDLVSELKTLGAQVTLVPVSLGHDRWDSQALLQAELIILRAPWTATPEEKVLSVLLERQLRPLFEKFGDPETGGHAPKLLGIGRGALILLESGLIPENLRVETWIPALRERGPWLSAQVLPTDLVLPALVSGRYLPKFAAPIPKEVSEWISFEGECVGWRLGPGLLLSFVDILAFSDRSQLEEFGYMDLFDIPTRLAFLEKLVDRSILKNP